MKENLKIIVTTCNKSDWTLQPFAYLFNEYWNKNKNVDVICESIPKFKLPTNFSFHPVNLSDNGWPKEQWTDGLIKYLNSISEQFVLIMLDDYWINRGVDQNGIQAIHEYMEKYRSILRIDLTLDRFFANGPKYPPDNPIHDSYKHLDFYNRPGSQYQISLMPGIWNKKLLLEILQPNWTPWQVELEGTHKVNQTSMVILGTSQSPIKITNALRNENDFVDTSNIKSPHLEVIQQWLPNDK